MKISLLEVLGACWKVARGIAVIMGAVLIIPIVGEQNKSMAWGSTRNGVSLTHGVLCRRRRCSWFCALEACLLVSRSHTLAHVVGGHHMHAGGWWLVYSPESSFVRFLDC